MPFTIRNPEIEQMLENIAAQQRPFASDKTNCATKILELAMGDNAWLKRNGFIIEAPAKTQR